MSAYDPKRTWHASLGVRRTPQFSVQNCDILWIPEVVLGVGKAMRRREFIAFVSGAAVVWPLTTRAQQTGRLRVVGVLMAATQDDPRYQTDLAVFREGLQKLGWIDGQNVRIEVRWAALDVEAMKRLAKELVAMQPDLILSNDTPTTGALLQETRSLPIVFATVSDPVGSGFVASLPKPGGNVTGFATNEGSLGGKWVELLKEIAPHVQRAALLFNPVTAPYYEYVVKSFKAAAASHGMKSTSLPVHDMAATETAIAAQARESDSGLVVLNDDFTIANRSEIVSLAARYELPTVYPFQFFVELGGLASYGIDLTDNFRRAASYVDRILKGERTTDLPVQGPVKFELVVNLKTAKALGLQVSETLLARADQVIE
jgi:putative tryptophan/tyrosine transport system substrate-binding protein